MTSWIGIGIFSIVLAYIGYMYVKDGLRKYNKKMNSDNLSKKREWAREHVPVKSSGCSLDKRDIYVPTLEELGLKSSKNKESPA